MSQDEDLEKIINFIRDTEKDFEHFISRYHDIVPEHSGLFDTFNLAWRDVKPRFYELVIYLEKEKPLGKLAAVGLTGNQLNLKLRVLDSVRIESKKAEREFDAVPSSEKPQKRSIWRRAWGWFLDQANNILGSLASAEVPFADLISEFKGGMESLLQQEHSSEKVEERHEESGKRRIERGALLTLIQIGVMIIVIGALISILTYNNFQINQKYSHEILDYVIQINGVLIGFSGIIGSILITRKWKGEKFYEIVTYIVMSFLFLIASIVSCILYLGTEIVDKMTSQQLALPLLSTFTGVSMIIVPIIRAKESEPESIPK